MQYSIYSISHKFNFRSLQSKYKICFRSFFARVKIAKYLKNKKKYLSCYSENNFFLLFLVLIFSKELNSKLNKPKLGERFFNIFFRCLINLFFSPYLSSFDYRFSLGSKPFRNNFDSFYFLKNELFKINFSPSFVLISSYIKLLLKKDSLKPIFLTRNLKMFFSDFLLKNESFEFNVIFSEIEFISLDIMISLVNFLLSELV